MTLFSQRSYYSNIRYVHEGLHGFGTHDVRDGLDDTDVHYGYNYRDIRVVSDSFEDSEYSKASPSPKPINYFYFINPDPDPLQKRQIRDIELES